ncbi:DUF3139 domain-containing protein [Paenibacillus tengchongensis]|uniref:DUF3139 domain-containing protein n=1 Tax=Paenibacillus tengchongensis TaxID=2608684 RepID=UPI00124D63BF|nr:DUF3139 domain-containing protein [Paenibacillus tengchongensis]
MKRKPLLYTALALTVVWGAASAGLQLFKQRTNREIEAYLINRKGYSRQLISTIYTQIGKAPVVSTTVIFSDDRGSRYFYRKENGRIYQYSMAPLHGAWDGRRPFKHAETYRD